VPQCSQKSESGAIDSPQKLQMFSVMRGGFPRYQLFALLA